MENSAEMGKSEVSFVLTWERVMAKASQMSRAKNLSPLPCRLDMLTLGLAHCLRAHNVILRDNNEKKLAYAELTHWEMSKK
jgi:hypothetical protein